LPVTDKELGRAQFASLMHYDPEITAGLAVNPPDSSIVRKARHIKMLGKPLPRRSLP
jgi:hypothetical protein